MLRLLMRRVLLLLLLVPLLNAAGYVYAMRAQPLVYDSFGKVVHFQDGQMVTHVGAVEQPSLTSQYVDYLRQGLAGDWGLDRIPVRRFALASGQLLGITLLVVVLLGPLCGLLALNRRTRRVRPSAVSLFALGSSLPGFFLATLAMWLLVVGKRQGWYTARGYLIPIQGMGFDKHMILPVAVLALRPVMYVAGVTAGLLEHELQQDYVQVARSKGLRWGQVLRRHAFPNVRATTLVALGQALQFVIGGLILIEPLFDWRGIGWLLVAVFFDNRRSYANEFIMNEHLLAVLLPLFGVVMLLVDTLPRVLAYALDTRLEQRSHA